jgi:hypothetical protein
MAAWGTFVGIVALVLALMWGWPYFRSRHGTGVSAVSTPSVGTTGQQNGGVAEDSPATLHDLETVTGSTDPHELIGRRVDFHLRAEDINNDASFWVGNKDNRMLVVLGPTTAVTRNAIAGHPRRMTSNRPDQDRWSTSPERLKAFRTRKRDTAGG